MNHVVDFRDIETSSSHICANEDASLAVDKLKKGGCALLLFLLAMDRQNLGASVGAHNRLGQSYRKIYVVKKFGLFGVSYVKNSEKYSNTHVIVHRVAA